MNKISCNKSKTYFDFCVITLDETRKKLRQICLGQIKNNAKVYTYCIAVK